MVLEDGSWYQGGFNNLKMHGEGTLHFANGNAYVGGFENDQRHGMGYLFDFENQAKVREEWVKGQRKNFVKTPSTTAELNEHLKKEGYYYQNQKTPMTKTVLRNAKAGTGTSMITSNKLNQGMKIAAASRFLGSAQRARNKDYVNVKKAV